MVASLTPFTLIEQCFRLPGDYSWEQLESLEALLGNDRSLRITYLDGHIELMTLGEQHEEISRLIVVLLGLYFFHKRIPFIPVGSASRRDRSLNVAFQPDESYYIGQRKAHPDLAIEVIISRGGLDKLEKYKRLESQEVWFWEEQRIQVYGLRRQLDSLRYEALIQSELLLDLDLRTFEQCLLLGDGLAAQDRFLQGLL